MFDDFRRDASDDNICGNIFCDHRAGGNDSVIPDRDPFRYDNAGADPNVISYTDRGIVGSSRALSRRAFFARYGGREGTRDTCDAGPAVYGYSLSSHSVSPSR